MPINYQRGKNTWLDQVIDSVQKTVIETLLSPQGLADLPLNAIYGSIKNSLLAESSLQFNSTLMMNVLVQLATAQVNALFRTMFMQQAGDIGPLVILRAIQNPAMDLEQWQDYLGNAVAKMSSAGVLNVAGFNNSGNSVITGTQTVTGTLTTQSDVRAIQKPVLVGQVAGRVQRVLLAYSLNANESKHIQINLNQNAGTTNYSRSVVALINLNQETALRSLSEYILAGHMSLANFSVNKIAGSGNTEYTALGEPTVLDLNTLQLTLANTGATFGQQGVIEFYFYNDIDFPVVSVTIDAVGYTTTLGSPGTYMGAGQILSGYNGTAAAPAYAFSANPNRGLSSDPANGMVMSVGGVNRTVWTSTGFKSILGYVLQWSTGATDPTLSADTGISRGPNPGNVAIGNGTAGDKTGVLLASKLGLGTANAAITAPSPSDIVLTDGLNQQAFRSTSSGTAWTDAIPSPNHIQFGVANGYTVLASFSALPFNRFFLSTKVLQVSPTGYNSILPPASANNLLEILNTTPIRVATIDNAGNLFLTRGVLANAGVNQNSPLVQWTGAYWDGAAEQFLTWQVQNAVGAGTSAGTSLIWTPPANAPSTTFFIIQRADLQLVQTVAATSGANQNSPMIYWYARFWDGAASQPDSWSVRNQLGAGTNPSSTLQFQHAGTSGQALVQVPALITSNWIMTGTNLRGTTSAVIGFNQSATDPTGATNAGLSSLGTTGQVLVGNGTAGDKSGQVVMASVKVGPAATAVANMPLWTSGAGSPEGVVTGPVGSLYTRTDGGAGTTLYVKETGVGNTGWVAK
jgi:hypothetical protein